MWLRKTRKKPLPIRLSGSRVYLRPANFSDHAQWVSVRGRNAGYLRPYEPLWLESWATEAAFRRRVDLLSKEWDQGRTYGFLIFDATADALIGGININNVVRGAGQMASLGYWLDESCQGQGLMTESVGLVLDFAFDDLKLARINAATLAQNDRSKKMLLNLGFVEEGFARDYIQIEGQRQDHVLYGLNVQDWISGRSAL